MSSANAILDQLVAKAGHLYSLPAVAMRVLQLTEDPKVDTRDLKECIENDPALTTKILRVVNSSLFGLSREVSDLNQAIALLGTKPLKLLVLGFSLPAGFFAGLTVDMLGRYWRHTLTKAVAARELSETVWHQPGDEAFIAGLLQDLGILVLIQELGPPYLAFLEKVYQRGADLLTLETESLGFDHTQLTSRLLDHWGLPKTLAEAARLEAHAQASDFASPDSWRLSQILALAEHITAWLADGRANALEQLLESDAQRQGLSPQRLEDMVAALQEKVQQLADVLCLKLPEGRDYADVLVQAHERLAEVAAEAAGELLRQQRGRTPKVHVPDANEKWVAEHVQSLHEAAARFSRRGAPPPAADPPAIAGEFAAMDAFTPESTLSVALGTHATTAHSVATHVSAPPSTAPTMSRAAATASVMEVDPGVVGQLTAAVNSCRQSRCALSLLLVAINDTEDLVLTRGVDGFGKLRRFLGTTCRNLEHPNMTCLSQGEAGFVLILPDCDRSSAVRLGNLLIDGMRRLSTLGDRDHRTTLTLSVGVATVSLPPKNFPARDLLAAADRCLYGSRASGGGVVKSIEIY